MTDKSKVIPVKQTAIIQDEHGHAILNHDSPVPQLRDGCVLVKTVAVALNPSDYKMGAAFPSAGAIVGTDFAGHVIAIHASVSASSQFSIGDAVCGISHGSNPGDHESGAFGQYVLAQAELLLRVNEAWLPLPEAAALGTALFTACAALWGSLNLPAKPEPPFSHAQRGDELPVLVYGGSTACGSMAIQLLSLSGFHPIATCSPRNFEMVKSFGAEGVFDYSDPSVASEIRKSTRGRLRHALDCITDKQSVACCFGALGRPGGRYACLEAFKEEWRTREVVKADFVMSLEVFGKDLKLGGEYRRDSNPVLHALAQDLTRTFQQLLDQKRLRPHPVHVVGRGFSTILDGLTDLKSGSVYGKKLVVIVD